MINLRKENGSISVMVLVTILFIIVILSSTFVINSTQRKSQLLSQLQLKDTYEADMYKVDEIYASLPGRSWEETEDGSISNGKIKVQVGDYVNYPNPTTVQVTGSGYSQTGYTSPASRTGMSTADGYTSDIDQKYTLNSSTKWVVLGLSEDGNKLLLTTEEPLQRDYNSSATISVSNSSNFYLRGAKGCAYEYGINELNKICAIYKNKYAEEIRSLTIDDINRLCKVNVDIANKKVTKIGDTTNINEDQPDILGINKTYTNQYKTPEDYILNGISGKTASFSIISNSYRYNLGNVINNTTELYKILNAGNYFLASRGIGTWESQYNCGLGKVSYSRVISYCDDMFLSYGENDEGNGTVRPVLTLKSNVELIAAGTNTWNIVEQ